MFFYSCIVPLTSWGPDRVTRRMSSILIDRIKDCGVKLNFQGHGVDRILGFTVSEVAFSYDGREPWLLSDWEIGAGCGPRIAIAGPNSAGKSTLLNLKMQ